MRLRQQFAGGHERIKSDLPFSTAAWSTPADGFWRTTSTPWRRRVRRPSPCRWTMPSRRLSLPPDHRVLLCLRDAPPGGRLEAYADELHRHLQVSPPGTEGAARTTAGLLARAHDRACAPGWPEWAAVPLAGRAWPRPDTTAALCPYGSGPGFRFAPISHSPGRRGRGPTSSRRLALFVAGYPARVNGRAAPVQQSPRGPA